MKPAQPDQTEPDWTLPFRNGSSEVVSLLIGSQCELEASFWISSQRFQLPRIRPVDPQCVPVRSGPVRSDPLLCSTQSLLHFHTLWSSLCSGPTCSPLLCFCFTVLYLSSFGPVWCLMHWWNFCYLIPVHLTRHRSSLTLKHWFRISGQNNPDLWFVLTFCISIAELLIDQVFPSGSAQSPVLVSNSELFYWCIFYFEGFIRLPAGSVWSQNQSDRRSEASVFSAVCYFCPMFFSDQRLILAPDPTEPDCLHCIISACMCSLMLNDAEWPDHRLSVHWETQCAAEQSAGQYVLILGRHMIRVGTGRRSNWTRKHLWGGESWKYKLSEQSTIYSTLKMLEYKTDVKSLKMIQSDAETQKWISLSCSLLLISEGCLLILVAFIGRRVCQDGKVLSRGSKSDHELLKTKK